LFHNRMQTEPANNDFLKMQLRPPIGKGRI
jgi:hypothetical protein